MHNNVLMNVIHKDYCSKCKTKTEPLMKYSRNKTTQYYRCRECQAEKMRNYLATPEGLLVASNNRDKMNKKYPMKFRARQKVADAIKAGKLNKNLSCELCNSGGRIEGHHMDYNKPLEVMWLCTSCHAGYHKSVAL